LLCIQESDDGFAVIDKRGPAFAIARGSREQIATARCV